MSPLDRQLQLICPSWLNDTILLNALVPLGSALLVVCCLGRLRMSTQPLWKQAQLVHVLGLYGSIILVALYLH